MRRPGMLTYEWLVDHTRSQRRPYTYDSVQQALEETARLYRKSLGNGGTARGLVKLAS